LLDRSSPTTINHAIPYHGNCRLDFCAKTSAGSLYETVEILTWDWASTPLHDACYAGSLGQDVLTIDGQSGGLLRSVQVAEHQPFVIGMTAPGGMPGGAGCILLLAPRPMPGAPGTQLGLDNSCMPMTTPGGCVARCALV